MSKNITGRHVAARNTFAQWLTATAERARRRAAATAAQYEAWGATTTTWKDFA